MDKFTNDALTKEERAKRRAFRAEAAAKLEATITRKEYEDTVRGIEKMLRIEITREVTKKVRAEVEKEYEDYIKFITGGEDLFEQLIARRSGYITREMFHKIRACLHPDQNHFPGAEEAFKAVGELEPVLVRQEPADVPAWIADLFRR